MDEQKKVVIAVISFVFIVAVAVFLYFFVFSSRDARDEEKPEPVEKVVALEETPVLEPKEPEFTQISLDDSDGIVRKLAAVLTSHPTADKWLESGDIVRNFVAAIDNLARGQSPSSNIRFFSPGEKFLVQETGDALIISPQSYERYDLVAEVFNSLDTEETVRLYKQMRPVLQEAFAELGFPDDEFHPRFLKAARELLAVPSNEGDIELIDDVGTYSFADPALEALSPAQKHLLRMGPENLRKVQNKLRALLQALGADS